MAFVDKCPKCGGQLYISYFIGHPGRHEILVEPDGFVIEGDISTSEEAVLCENGDYDGPLQYAD